MTSVDHGRFLLISLTSVDCGRFSLSSMTSVDRGRFSLSSMTSVDHGLFLLCSMMSLVEAGGLPLDPGLTDRLQPPFRADVDVTVCWKHSVWERLCWKHWPD